MLHTCFLITLYSSSTTHPSSVLDSLPRGHLLNAINNLQEQFTTYYSVAKITLECDFVFFIKKVLGHHFCHLPYSVFMYNAWVLESLAFLLVSKSLCYYYCLFTRITWLTSTLTQQYHRIRIKYRYFANRYMGSNSKIRIHTYCLHNGLIRSFARCMIY